MRYVRAHYGKVLVGTELIVIGVAAFLACLLVLTYALKKRRFGPRQLGPSARVRHEGVDYKVRGSLTCRQGPYLWWEHLLEGGHAPRRLGVDEVEGRPDLTWWVKRTELELRPAAEHVVDGTIFRQIERGRARYTAKGTTGLPANGIVDYIDYTNADESAVLRFQRWTTDMPWEISTGNCLQPRDITVHPARSR